MRKVVEPNADANAIFIIVNVEYHVHDVKLQSLTEYKIRQH